MSLFFSGRELVEIALQIERNGFAFYTVALERAADPRAKQVYAHLRSEEERHIAIFERLSPEGLAEESYPEEATAYVQALATSRVFTDQEQVSQAVAQAPSPDEVLRLGMGFEKDSILFYTQMRELVKRSGREVVDMLLAEEKRHLRQLAELRRGLG